MMRKIRAVTAVLFLFILTLLFLDFTGGLHAWFGWMAKVQFLPALLALNAGIVLALVVLTLLFGRVYCSVICPLGVFQDVVSWVAGKFKKRRFRYSSAMSWLRYGVLGAAVLAFVLGAAPLVALLDPYGAYGRIAANLFAPVYRLGNNLLAYFAESAGSYAFYTTDVWVKSSITLTLAIATLVIVGILAWRNGRTYCNTICPVGTMLGTLARFSVFRPAINAEACTKCNKCARSCKASCIDVKTSRIDYSRCVACFDCMEQCSEKALKYVSRSAAKKAAAEVKTDSRMAFAAQPVNAEARRGFLSATALMLAASAAKAQQQVQLQVDGGLADIADKQPPVRNTPLVPPGATGLRNMKQRCIACQLCVSACPNNVLRPSSKLSTLMQPEMSFEKGFCRPECVECSAVCPSGAIKPVTAADKTAISAGYAVWNESSCVVNTQKLPCTACERHCPTKAITLVAVNPEDENRQGGFPGRRPPVLKVPVIDKELCTGCGACEYLCPSRPFSAIHVEGNTIHHSI